MSKIYVVRELAFMYNDESHYTGQPGGIIGHYNDETSARAEINKRSISLMKIVPLAEYDQFFNPDPADMQTLRAYLAPILDEEIMDYYKQWGQYRIKQQIYLPQTLTDEQVIKMMEIMKISFFELLEFEDVEPVFYIMWIPRLGHPLQMEIDYSFRGDPKEISPIFYETREKLFDAIDDYRFLFLSIPIDNTFEELSDTPGLLESYVQDKQSFKVQDGKLKLNYVKREEIIGFNALLKEPLFEVRTISLAEASKISHNPFIAM